MAQGKLCKSTPKSYAKQNGIEITNTAPENPQSNGQAERAISTLKDCILASLSSSGLPKRDWDFAVRDCAKKWNCIPRNDSSTSPYELMFNIKPDIRRSLTFGAHGFVPSKSANRGSLSPRGIRVRYLAPVNNSLFTVRNALNKKLMAVRATDFFTKLTNNLEKEEYGNEAAQGLKSCDSKVVYNEGPSRTLRPR